MAARLVVSPLTGHQLGRAAVELPVRFPMTAGRLHRGRVCPGKVQVLVSGCRQLDDEQARAVDARVAGVVQRQSVSRWRQTVRRAVLRVDAAAAAQRRARAEADRCVRIRPADDGMAELWALLPAVAATGLARRLDDQARAAKAGGDTRTLDQLRADALADGVRGTVELQVVVPASVLLGVGDDPAELVGHGPVDAELVRTLATDSTWRRLLTDPRDDTLLSAGATTYRPGAVLARHVTARDRTCRFPSCDRPAASCDLDHTVPFGAALGGAAEPGNLGPLCRGHHLYKHSLTLDPHGPSRMRQPDPGHFVWTLPTGHHHHVHPPPLLEPDDPLTEAARGARARRRLAVVRHQLTGHREPPRTR